MLRATVSLARVLQKTGRAAEAIAERKEIASTRKRAARRIQFPIKCVEFVTTRPGHLAYH